VNVAQADSKQVVLYRPHIIAQGELMRMMILRLALARLRLKAHPRRRGSECGDRRAGRYVGLSFDVEQVGVRLRLV